MYYSQVNQDKILEECVFNGFKNGFYVDVGAHDGISINNTLFFHRERGWKGINIEANPDVFLKLKENRADDLNLNVAILNENGAEIDFYKNTGYTEMLSGVVKKFDQRHLNRMKNEIQTRGGGSEIIKIPSKRLETIFDYHNITNINYLSIDVEGAEFDVIKSINFDKVFIDVIDFENNFYDKSIEIVKYLEARGFTIIYQKNDIFMINKESKFEINSKIGSY